VTAYKSGEPFDSHRERTDGEPNVRRPLVTAFALTNGNTNRLQAGPLFPVDQIRRNRHLIVGDFIDASVTFQRFDVSTSFDVGEVIFHVLFDVVGHGVMQLSLIAFERQNVVAFPVNDLLSDRSLTTRRVDGDDRIFDFSIVEKSGTLTLAIHDSKHR